MNSAFVSGQYYPTTSKAEREFRILSVKEQSNVDRLTGTSFLYNILKKKHHKIVFCVD